MQKKHLLNPVVAHRGAWLEYDLPENSIAALKKAIEIGVGGSEFDVHMTKDNILVVNHDSDFFGIDIQTSNYEDLLVKKLSNGENLPTVASFLEIGLKQNKTKLIFEIKSSEVCKSKTLNIVIEVIKIFENKCYENQIEFILFCWESAIFLKEKLPKYVVSYLNGDKTAHEVFTNGLDGLDYNLNVYKEKPNFIWESKNKKLLLNVWTVNDVEDFDMFLRNEFDMITTNKPALFLEIYKNKGNF